MSPYLVTVKEEFPVGTPLEKYKSLRDILCSSIPSPPRVDPPDALGGTKETTQTEVATFPLNTVVYCPGIFENLLEKGEVLAKQVSFNHTNPQHLDFAAYTIPSIPRSLYPKKFHSEEAVAWWSTFSIFWPVMAALRCVYFRKSSVCFEDEAEFPFLSSGAAIRIIPDAVVITGEAVKGQEGRPQIKGDVEFKSPNAFAHAKLESLMPDLERHPYIWPQDPFDAGDPSRTGRGESAVASSSTTSKSAEVGKKGDPKRARGGKSKDPVPAYPFNAMRFLWPEVETNTASDDHHQTRVILQVWAQMVDRKANVGVLSCADRTVLFIRDRETSVVYMSQQYGPESRPLLAVFSLFAAGLGLIDIKSLKVEEMTHIIDPDAVKKAEELKEIRAAEAEEARARAEAEKAKRGKGPNAPKARKKKPKTDQKYIGIYRGPSEP